MTERANDKDKMDLIMKNDRKLDPSDTKFKKYLKELDYDYFFQSESEMFPPQSTRIRPNDLR